MLKKKKKAIVHDAALEKRVAIDIGLYSIKFAYFKNDLLYLQEFPLFEDVKDIRGLEQQDLSESQTAVIKSAIKMINPRAELILSPQPSLHVLTRIFHQPPETDLKSFLEKVLPFEPDKFTFDVQKLDSIPLRKKSSKKAEKDSKIVVVASDLDHVHRSIEVLGDFQLQIKQFLPSSITLLNYILLSKPTTDGKPLILLDLGATYSHLIVYRKKDQFLVRTLNLGGNHLNLELVKQMNVDFETAEKIKLERALIDESLLSTTKQTGVSSMFQAISTIIYSLVDEIKNTMTYFEDLSVSDISDSTVLLAGGTSKLKNLDRFLSKELGLSVKRVQYPAQKLAPESKFEPQFASTVGLLGDTARDDLYDINLLKNVDGMLFRLKEGDHYLTREGFLDKKTYKKRRKSRPIESTGSTKSKVTEVLDPAPTVVALVKELQEKVRAFLRGEKVDMRVSFREIDHTPITNRLKNTLVVLGTLFLVLIIAYQFWWSPKMKRIYGAINGYVGTNNELLKERAALKPEENPGVPETTIKVTDKMLWTNKLKAIAIALPEEVWISNLEIEGSMDEIEDLKVFKRSLTLDCHATSDSGEHLKAIAKFIRNIKLQKDFLKDFTEVKFHSAARNPENQDTLDFSLTLPLRRNLLEESEKPVEKEKRPKKEGAEALKEMIKHFKKAQDKRTEEYDVLRK